MIDVLKHVTVYHARGVYAGWPANHGAWQWGDEFLVGFMTGPHTVGGMHNIREPYAKVLSRSLDGGETWMGENPNVDFSASETMDNAAPHISGSDIIRVCGRYDHGGYDAVRKGGFYVSSDRGKTWRGAFEFDGLEKHFTGQRQNTSRTSVLGNLTFLTSSDRNRWGTDYVFCATDNGVRFCTHSIVLQDDCRAVMPKAVRVGDRIVVVMRRLGHRYDGGWIDAVHSDDGGRTWSKPRLVGKTGSSNGNPPALAESGGLLFCAFANRSEKDIRVAVSRDGGETWLNPVEIRRGGDSDIGYPQLFKRSDGTLVCVYYWADSYNDCQRIEATMFRAAR